MAAQGTTPPAQPPTTSRTGGGGSGPQKAAYTTIDTPDGPVKVWKARKPMIEDEDFGFKPHSLVGSWFHRLENDRIVWQGAVIAEPQAATYLVQIDRLDIGAENVQRLIPLERMVNDEDGYDWRFYDSEGEARTAYAAWVATARERAAA